MREPLCFSLSISCKSVFAFFFSRHLLWEETALSGSCLVRWQCFGCAATLNALITNTVTLPSTQRNTFCFFPWSSTVLLVELPTTNFFPSILLATHDQKGRRDMRNEMCKTNLSFIKLWQTKPKENDGLKTFQGCAFKNTGKFGPFE